MSKADSFKLSNIYLQYYSDFDKEIKHMKIKLMDRKTPISSWGKSPANIWFSTRSSFNPFSMKKKMALLKTTWNWWKKVDNGEDISNFKLSVSVSNVWWWFIRDIWRSSMSVRCMRRQSQWYTWGTSSIKILSTMSVLGKSKMILSTLLFSVCRSWTTICMGFSWRKTLKSWCWDSSYSNLGCRRR